MIRQERKAEAKTKLRVITCKANQKLFAIYQWWQDTGFREKRTIY